MVCIHQDDQASKRLDLGLSGCHGASTRLLFVASLGPDWRILSQTHIKVELPAGMSDTHQPPIVLFGKMLFASNFTNFPPHPPAIRVGNVVFVKYAFVHLSSQYLLAQFAPPL